MIPRILKRWFYDTAAAAAAEFALIFPILMVLLVGVYELGNAISINQRSIAASQIIADLIARNASVDAVMIDEAIRAGELAVEPYSLEEMGVDIVSLEYDDNDEPQVVWRETRNMDENDDAVDRAVGLGVEGDGALVVTVQYIYNPIFGSPLTHDIVMQELSFARGRRTAIIAMNEEDDDEE